MFPHWLPQHRVLRVLQNNRSSFTTSVSMWTQHNAFSLRHLGYFTQLSGAVNVNLKSASRVRGCEWWSTFTLGDTYKTNPALHCQLGSVHSAIILFLTNGSPGNLLPLLQRPKIRYMLPTIWNHFTTHLELLIIIPSSAFIPSDLVCLSVCLSVSPCLCHLHCLWTLSGGLH